MELWAVGAQSGCSALFECIVVFSSTGSVGVYDPYVIILYNATLNTGQCVHSRVRSVNQHETHSVTLSYAQTMAKSHG